MGIINITPSNDAERKLMAGLGPWKPVVITLDAQEIGALYKANGGPPAFLQYLLNKFKAEGVPVEGVLTKKLAHGKVFKVKQSPRGPGFFDYMWLPDSYVDKINSMGGVQGQIC